MSLGRVMIRPDLFFALPVAAIFLAAPAPPGFSHLQMLLGTAWLLHGLSRRRMTPYRTQSFRDVFSCLYPCMCGFCIRNETFDESWVSVRSFPNRRTALLEMIRWSPTVTYSCQPLQPSPWSQSREVLQEIGDTAIATLY